MRHLSGTALAVLMAAVMFFAGAWGYLRLLKLPVAQGQGSALPAGGGGLLSDHSMLLALAALLATAVLAGLLVTLRRVSPLAAGLPGVLLLAWTALYLVSVRRAVNFIPLRSDAFGAGWEALLFNGILGAAGAVMILPMLVPSRWRGPARARAASAPASGAADRGAFEADDYLAPPRSPGRTRPREDELVGSVLTSPSGGSVRPVDTTRVTGASRALRATGSFSATTGAIPRSTGSFRTTTDTSLLGRPYYRDSPGPHGYEASHE